MMQSFLVSPLQSHEMARVSLQHPELRAGDVLVGDLVAKNLTTDEMAEKIDERVRQG